MLRLCLLSALCLVVGLTYFKGVNHPWRRTHRLVEGWNSLGCPTKILDLTEAMPEQFQARGVFLLLRGGHWIQIVDCWGTPWRCVRVYICW